MERSFFLSPLGGFYRQVSLYICKSYQALPTIGTLHVRTVKCKILLKYSLSVGLDQSVSSCSSRGTFSLEGRLTQPVSHSARAPATPPQELLLSVHLIYSVLIPKISKLLANMQNTCRPTSPLFKEAQNHDQ